MNDFTSSNQSEYELIRRKLSEILRSYSFPEKVSMAIEYDLPPGVQAWLDKTMSDAAQGNPDATTKSLDDEKDDVVKLIREKLVNLVFTDSRNTSHEQLDSQQQQEIYKLFKEMRDFIASELCVHYTEDTIKFLLSHGDNLEFMQDTDAFLVHEGLSGHELASALDTILEDKSLGISTKQQLHLRAIAEKAKTSSVQINRQPAGDGQRIEEDRETIEEFPKDMLCPTMPTASSTRTLHHGKAPPGAETILTAQQAGIGIADFRIRRVESDGFFVKAREYTAIFCPNKHTEAIVRHAFPEARRSTKWSDKSEPPAMLVSTKIAPDEVRASLSRSLSAFRLDKQTGKVSFER